MAEAQGIEIAAPRSKGRGHLVLDALKGFWGFVRHKPLGGISALFLIVVIVVAVFAPLIAPNDPDRVFAGMRFAGLGATASDGTRFLLGGDEVGRDLLSRVIFGSRIALEVGIVAVGIGVISGAVLGLVSGYYGGTADLLIQRFVDSVMAFPALILALLIMSLLGASTVNAMIAIGVVLMPVTARVVRAQALSVKENVYVDSARAIGATNTYIMARYIFPNVAHAIIIIAAAFFGTAILVEASLSFLGIGTPQDVPSWGVMIAGPGRGQLQAHPRMLIVPAVALSLTVLSFNLLGDALRDVWDPRLRNT